MDNFNEKRETDSQFPDFRVNEFASGNTPYNKDFMGQNQFPQFGKNAGVEDIRSKIESSKSNGWGAQLTGFIGRSKKRLIVLVAIIALFSASSYLSNKSQSEQDEEGAKKSSGIAGISQNIPEQLNEPNSENQTLQESLDIKLGEDGQVILEKENPQEAKLLAEIADGDVITVSAQRGDGITHLARQALKEYLEKEGKTLSAEQKVYAEDYTQNKTGNELLEIDQKLSFAKDLLKEAVEKAESLSSLQIENLKKYTAIASLL